MELYCKVPKPVHRRRHPAYTVERGVPKEMRGCNVTDCLGLMSAT